MLSQIWDGLAGPVTMLVIAQFLTSEQQGYYYTFNSVLALQIFVELGLVTVLIQFASHEWAFLDLDESRRIKGDARALSRLSSVMRFGVSWYAICGLLIAIGLSVGRYVFFLDQTELRCQLAGSVGFALRDCGSTNPLDPFQCNSRPDPNLSGDG